MGLYQIILYEIILIPRPFYGLFVNKTLKKGNTHECETFCNPMLTDEESFKIIKLEVTLTRFGDSESQSSNSQGSTSFNYNQLIVQVPLEIWKIGFKVWIFEILEFGFISRG